MSWSASPSRASGRCFDAVDALGTDAWVASFTPDGYVDDWGRRFAGPDRLRQWSDAEFIGKNVTLDVTDVKIHHHDIVVIAQVGDGFNGRRTFTFAVQTDRVSSMTITA